jgi:hypothetical protein
MATEECATPGCPRPVVARFMCGMHYARLRRHDPDTLRRLPTAREVDRAADAFLDSLRVNDRPGDGGYVCVNEGPLGAVYGTPPSLPAGSPSRAREEAPGRSSSTPEGGEPPEQTKTREDRAGRRSAAAEGRATSPGMPMPRGNGGAD